MLTIIDTNILYSLAGISVNEKVTQSAIEELDLAITTASLIEAIVKHRYDLNKIKESLSLVINKKMTLLSIGHCPLSSDDINKLYYARKLEDISNIIEKVVELKISREAEFYRFLLVLITVGMFEILKETDFKFSDNEKNQYQEKMLIALFLGNEGEFLNGFIKVLRNGYREDKAEQFALECFESYVVTMLRIFYIYHIEIDNKPNFSYSEKQFKKKFKKYLDNPVSCVSKKSFRHLSDDYIKNIKDELKDVEEITAKSLEYLLVKLEKALKEKYKIRKNDIFDFLIVFSLDYPCSKFVTLDKEFQKLLKEVSLESYELCNDLGFIS